MFSKRFNFIKVGGIQIGVDLSWLLIAILLTWTLAVGHFPYVYPGQTLSLYWLMGFIGMIGLFVCIVLHELGHAFVAKYFKIPISQITLFLFGGVAEIKKDPKNPKEEFLVAIGGPIVTLFLSVILFACTYYGTTLWQWPLAITGITSYLTTINLLILLFNLIPAFPLDGGRVLRAILWKYKNDLGWATKLSSRIGAGFGLFLTFFGIFSLITGNLLGGMWLVILGLFLQKTASASQAQFYVGKELENEKVSKFMTKNIETVSPNITISELLKEHIYKSHHHLYPVSDKEILGYISIQEIKQIPQENWDQALVGSFLVPIAQCPKVSPNTHALEALSLMQESQYPTLLVTENNQLVGLLTSQDLFKVIALKLELEDERK